MYNCADSYYALKITTACITKFCTILNSYSDQLNNDDKDSLSPSSGNDHLYTKEDEHEGSGAEASKEMESLFSSLEKFEFRDLPSFAYQVCNGMVSKSNKPIP